MPKIDVNQTSYYYELHGKGEPLILISGYTCSHTCWEPILDDLSKYFQVLIFDNPGSGQTKDNNQELSVESIADDVMTMATLLELNNPHIAGHSMGGTIAQRIAAKYGKNINKLILLMTSAKWRQAMLQGLKFSLHLRENNYSFDDIVNATLPWIYGEKFLRDNSQIEKFKADVLQDPFPQSIEDQKRQFNVLEKFNGLPQLTFIQSPTLLIFGTEDIIALPSEVISMSRKIAQSKVIECNSGHDAMTENPEFISSTCLNFLS